MFLIFKEEDISDEKYLNIHKIFEMREREYCLGFYKKKKDKEKKVITFGGASLADNITEISRDDSINFHRMKFNILSNEISI